MTTRTWFIQIIGVLLLTSILVYMMPTLIQGITEKIVASTRNALDENGLSWVITEATGRDITLKGMTLLPDEHKKAFDLVHSLWFVKKIDDEIKPKSISPYTMNIRWDGHELIANGYLPSNDDKQALEKTIEKIFAGKSQKIELEVAAGSPSAWMSTNEIIFSEISTFELASVTMTDNILEIMGRAQTTQEADAFEKLVNAFSTKGYRVKTHLLASDYAKKVCQDNFKQLLAQEKIYFQSNAAIIDSKSDQLLKKLADNTVLCANAKITIIGYTDNVGSDTKNQELSYQRAQAVKARLFSQGGIPSERMNAIGKGALEPIDTNDTEQGRANNRRIEFVVEDNK